MNTGAVTMGGCGLPRVKATKNRRIEALLLEGSTMNHTSSAPGLEDDGGTWQGG